MSVKRKTALVFATILLTGQFASSAATISGADAMTAARNWLDGEAMIAAGISTEPESVWTEGDGVGVAYHVVSLAGGGFVVLSADDGIEPVIAFSATGTFPAGGADDPVRALLARDLGGRAAELNVGGGTFKRMAFASGTGAATSPKAKWAKLLAAPAANVKQRVFANGRASVSDVRVAPLVKSQWGQEKDSGYSNKGSDCYNLYTPNNCPCGCSATAMAQIMRYWQYPAAVKPFARNCAVNGMETLLSVTAGAYDWGNMPLDPSKGTTQAQRESIGKLTYDCGVSMCTAYHGTSGAGAFAGFAFEPLKNCFGYANAMTYCPNGITADDIQQSVYPSLDAGCPVMMGFSDESGWGQHEVVADGYGFVSETPYVHLNVGWTAISGSDLWYNLPRVTFSMGSSSFAYSAIDNFVYNIFPDETGDVLSGRVTNEDGTPAAGVEVRVFASGSSAALATTATSQYGVYAFVIPGGAKYDVTAGDVMKAGIFVTKSINPSDVNLETGWYTPGNMANGNSWGNDLVLGETPEPEDPDPPEPPEPEDPDPAIAVSCELDGSVLRVGESVSFPVDISCTACAVKSVKATGLPTGLKFLSGKKAVAYGCEYVIAGTPTKATKKPATVKLTVQGKPDDKKVKMSPETFEYEVVVMPLDDWAVGTFSGAVEADGAAGTFTMTVKATGALSGKVTFGKKSYAFKASSLTASEDGGYRLEVEPTKWSGVLAFDLVPQPFGDDEFGAITNGGVTAAQEIWKLKDYKKFLKKYTSPDKTISWTTAGKVTWTTLNEKGKKTKYTSTLLPVSYEDGEVKLYAYFVVGGSLTRLDVSYDEDAPGSPACVFTPGN